MPFRSTTLLQKYIILFEIFRKCLQYENFSFYRNDVSSFPSTVVEENEGPCNCTSTKVGPSVSLYYESTGQYKLLWFDVASYFIMSSDLEGCNCKRIVDVKNVSKNGLYSYSGCFASFLKSPQMTPLFFCWISSIIFYSLVFLSHSSIFPVSAIHIHFFFL